MVHKSYIVVGSAPYIREWVNVNHTEMKRRHCEICPLNNAWSLFAPEDIGIWTYPCDLLQRGTLVPSLTQVNRMPDVREFMPKFYRRTFNGVSRRQEITWEKSYTMMIDTVYMLIDCDGAKKIYIIGCDMMYDNNKNYFYSDDTPNCKGTPDPLRHGKDVLTDALRKLYDYALERGVKVYNLSEQVDTLLPFQRSKLSKI
jgi:hypothetical protein